MKIIHWDATCAEQIFNLETTLTKLKMDYSLERERLLGEICCLKKQLDNYKDLVNQIVTVSACGDES